MYHFMEFSFWHELLFKGNIYIILFTVLLLKSASLTNILHFTCFWILWIESCQMLSLESGLLLLKIIKLSFIHIVVYDLAHWILRLYIIRKHTIIHPFYGGHLNGFYYLVIMKDAAMNIPKPISCYMYAWGSEWYRPIRGLAGSWGLYILNFARKYQTVF